MLNLLRNIRTSFTYLDKEMMRKIITSVIRLRLEYAAVIWSPHEKKHIRKLERVQRAATKMTPELQDLPYEERLARMQLTTLEKRRERGDMIILFRLLNGMENIDRGDLYEMNVRETRGHGRKLKAATCRRHIKKYSFPHRSIEAWNGLEEKVVCAGNIHIFKEKLDKYSYGDGTV